MNCRGCRLQCFDRLMPQIVACLEISSIIPNAEYVERGRGGGLMILAQRPGVSREGMGQRGSNSFFAQKLLISFYLNQDNSIVNCFLDITAFLTLSLPSTVALGLNFFSWKVFHVESSAICRVLRFTFFFDYKAFSPPTLARWYGLSQLLHRSQ